ncbi:MAG: Carboxypeptidase regulatory-like domain [Thermoplasmata archaeon]|nr:Carboxypeptidase regulatory-like domain [Thermoplasmata archaeon]
MKGVLGVAALLLCVALAGCGDKAAVTNGTTGLPPLPPDKGAIAGLVIDDVYRPVPKALVLIEKAGLTATSDGEGQFSFVGLEPGAYILKVQADGHAAAPRTVEVVAGQYADAEIQADRLFNSGARIVTTEYSVFVPCAASAVAATEVADCTFDQSGDSFRAGFDSNYTGYGNVTYLVTEMLTNHPASASSGAFKVVVREQGNGDYWGSKFITEGNYLKIVMRLNTKSADDTENRNFNWTNTKTMETVLFPQGAFKSESQGGLDAACANDPAPTKPSCFESRGVGAQAGVTAKFVQSLFLGEPALPIESYSTLKPSS